MSVKDRIYERKFESMMRTLATYRRVRIVHWSERDQHLYTGTDTLHRTPAARKIRTLQRLKVNRCK
jgi:hypothetical protein